VFCLSDCKLSKEGQMWKSVATFLLGCTCLSACAPTETIIQHDTIGATATLLTSADVRVITERQNPLDPTRNIICTEPSPDVAKALSASFKATGSGQGSAGAGVTGVGASAGLTSVSAEQLAQLTARVPAIQALRDGLYAACQAYGNGAIGDNAYSLIISRYGDILVTLILAEAAAGSGSNPLAFLQGMNLSIQADTPPKPADATPKDPKPAAKPPSATDPSGTKTSATEPSDGAPVFASVSRSPLAARGVPFLQPASLIATAMASPIKAVAVQDAKPAGGDAAGGKPAAEKPPADGKATPPKPPAKPAPGKKQDSSETPTGATPPAGAAQALQAMQSKYFDQPAIGPLVVACLNEFDLTRADSRRVLPNETLTGICRTFLADLANEEVDSLKQRTTAAIQIQKEQAAAALAAQKKK
jgi:hypothetical protein